MRAVPNLCAPGGYVWSMVSESDRTGGRNVAPVSLLTDADRGVDPRSELYDGLRGGSGGRCFGGDSKFMSGVDDEFGTP